MVVVFPAPLGPRNPNTSPGFTLKLIPATESTGALGYRLTRSETSTATAFSEPITLSVRPTSTGSRIHRQADGGDELSAAPAVATLTLRRGSGRGKEHDPADRGHRHGHRHRLIEITGCLHR